MTNSAPLSKLSPLQSLGYLEHGQLLECEQDLNWHSTTARGPMLAFVFKAGQSYPVRPFGIIVRRTVKRPSATGEIHEHALTGKDTAFALSDAHNHEWLFVDGRHLGEGIVITASRPIHPQFTFEVLVSHFRIPQPPSIAERNPDWIDYHLKMLEAIEQIVNSHPGNS